MSSTTQTAVMTVSLRLSENAKAKLAERAARSGQDVAAFASDLIEQAVTEPSLKELLALSASQFKLTGMTPEQIMDFGQGLLEKVRNEKGPGT